MAAAAAAALSAGDEYEADCDFDDDFDDDMDDDCRYFILKKTIEKIVLYSSVVAKQSITIPSIILIEISPHLIQTNYSLW